MRLIEPDHGKVDSIKLIKTYGNTVKETEPLIVRFENNKFFVDHQNDILLALKAKKVNAYPAFILSSSKEEHKTFMNNYGKHLILVDKL